MYFLNGDRIYIKPANGCAGFDAQLHDCLAQVEKINSGKRIFKLNFFVDTVSEEMYQKLAERLEELVAGKFSNSVIVTLIAQPPLTCRVLVEAFYYDAILWQADFIRSDRGAAIHLKRGKTEVLIGTVQSASGTSCRKNAAAVFEAFGKVMQGVRFPLNTVVRQWNYIENILGMEDEKQRYQEFNNIRSEFYAEHFNKSGFPSATGIGMNRGGIIIEFVAVHSNEAVSLPLDNPHQVAAHGYSKKVLVGENTFPKASPKFERARYLELFGRKQVFVSGTASIRGEETVGDGDPEKQTQITIQNMQRLYSGDVLSRVSGKALRPKYGHARVYIKNRKDFATIKKTFKRYYGNLPVVYIIADICRENLLVEIEGKVILE